MTLILLLCLLFPFSSEAKSEKLIKALSNKIQSSLITTPKSNEVCFSPNEFCDIKLQRFLESAEKSIDMAIYDINLKSLVDLILEKSNFLSLCPMIIILSRFCGKPKSEAFKSFLETV